MLLSRQTADDDRIETLEAMIKEANDAAREAENKLDEVRSHAKSVFFDLIAKDALILLIIKAFFQQFFFLQVSVCESVIEQCEVTPNREY